VPFLRRMWFAAKLFLKSLSVGLFSKREHPIDRGKVHAPGRSPGACGSSARCTCVRGALPRTGTAEYAPVGVATISPETPLARAVDSVVSAWISNPPRAGPYRPRSPASVQCNQETGALMPTAICFFAGAPLIDPLAKCGLHARQTGWFHPARPLTRVELAALPRVAAAVIFAQRSRAVLPILEEPSSSVRVVWDAPHPPLTKTGAL
jgi:hypothetical protein